MKKVITFVAILTMICFAGAPACANMVSDQLWIRAVIDTEEKGPVEAVWEKGGEGFTPAGDHVIWGHFYASPDDVSWGSRQNPDLFVKIWFDRSGRLDVNFFHVSVPAIEVWSDYPYDNMPDEHGVTTLSRRYIRHYYENGRNDMDVRYENGEPPPDRQPGGNPSGDSLSNDLNIAAVINTDENGPIDAVWCKGGEAETEGGHQVIWGYFHADPGEVNWGDEENPDLFVKVWFDVGGRVDVNFFHVSVPDIEVYSALPHDGTYHQKGTTILDNRYIRHEYHLDFQVKKIVLTTETLQNTCEEPAAADAFTDDIDGVNAWVHYRTSQAGKPYTFKWYAPDGSLARTEEGTAGYAGLGCSWKFIPRTTLMGYDSGTWQVEFYYDGQRHAEKDFEFIQSASSGEFEITDFIFTNTQMDECERPTPQTSFSPDDDIVYAWVDYRNFEGEKTHEFRWYTPDDKLASINIGSRKTSSDGCSYASMETADIAKYETGRWRVEFCYDSQVCQTEYFMY